MIYANLVNCEVFLALKDASILIDGEPTPINGVLGYVESAGADYLRIQVRSIADSGELYDGERPVEVTLHAHSITLAQLIEENPDMEDGEDDDDEEEEEAADG